MAADTGIRCTQACIKLYENEFYAKKLRYMLLNIVEDAETKKECVEVDSMGTREETFDDFVAKLKKLEDQGEPRFCCVKISYMNDQSTNMEKTVFIKWIPRTCNLRKKMMFTGSADGVKKDLEKIASYFTFNNTDEIILSDIINALKSL